MPLGTEKHLDDGETLKLLKSSSNQQQDFILQCHIRTKNMKELVLTMNLLTSSRLLNLR